MPEETRRRDLRRLSDPRRLSFGRNAAHLALLISWTAACSPGVGRDPAFADATVIVDSGYGDATPFPDARVDAGVPDSAVGLPDASMPEEYPFTGVFSILNSSDLLYARELDGQISLVVRNWPYVYHGTIDASGYVDTTSFELTAAGCAEATIKGQYYRSDVQYQLEHRTCSQDGTPLLSEIFGGFANDFEPSHSGVYELSVTVMGGFNCWTGPPTGHTARWGISFVGTSAVLVFTAVDLVAPAFYRGVPGGDFAFSALQQVDSQPQPVEMAMMGSFQQTTVNDPLRFTGVRDVWDFSKNCFFSVVLDGERVAGP